MMRKLRIVNDDGVGWNTKVFDAETGEKLEDFFEVDISIRANDLIAADCKRYLGGLEVVAEANIKEYGWHHGRWRMGRKDKHVLTDQFRNKLCLLF